MENNGNMDVTGNVEDMGEIDTSLEELMQKLEDVDRLIRRISDDDMIEMKRKEYLKYVEVLEGEFKEFSDNIPEKGWEFECTS